MTNQSDMAVGTGVTSTGSGQCSPASVIPMIQCGWIIGVGNDLGRNATLAFEKFYEAVEGY